MNWDIAIETVILYCLALYMPDAENYTTIIDNPYPAIIQRRTHGWEIVTIHDYFFSEKFGDISLFFCEQSEKYVIENF